MKKRKKLSKYEDTIQVSNASIGRDNSEKRNRSKIRAKKRKRSINSSVMKMKPQKIARPNFNLKENFFGKQQKKLKIKQNKQSFAKIENEAPNFEPKQKIPPEIGFTASGYPFKKRKLGSRKASANKEES